MQKRNFLKALGSVTFAALASGAGLSARASDARAPRILFVYVTRTGHTESIGKAVRHQLGDAARVDYLRVRTVEPYPSEYKPMTQVVKAEREQGIERKITAPAVNLKDYDVVILGTPTWWHHVAQPLATWIEGAAFDGQQVLTCNSHGGGGLMHTREDFEALLAKQNVRVGTQLTVYADVLEDDGEVKDWLAANGLLKAK